MQHVALRLDGFDLVELQQRQIPEPNFEVMGNDITLYQRIETKEIHQTEKDTAQLEVSKLDSLDLVDLHQLMTFEVKLEVMENDIRVLLLFETMKIHQSVTDVVQHVALRLDGLDLEELSILDNGLRILMIMISSRGMD